MVALNAPASFYLVGDVFGGWNPAAGVEMTENEDGTYRHSTTVNGTIWFIFGDSLDGDWVSFNANHRYGPTTGDEVVTSDVWYTTQRSSIDGAYQFTAFDTECEIVFNPATCQFIINTEMPLDPLVYTVAGSPSAVFGTEWDPNNTDNDMVQQGNLYHWTKTDVALTSCEMKFKVVQNHDWFQSWPDMEFVAAIEEDGFYSIDITFDPAADDDNKISCDIIKTGELNPLPLKGDLNGDGELTIADINLLIDAILSSYIESSFDVNGDSEINIADVNILISIIIDGDAKGKMF